MSFLSVKVCEQTQLAMSTSSTGDVQEEFSNLALIERRGEESRIDEQLPCQLFAARIALRKGLLEPWSSLLSPGHLRVNTRFGGENILILRRSLLHAQIEYAWQHVQRLRKRVGHRRSAHKVECRCWWFTTEDSWVTHIPTKAMSKLLVNHAPNKWG